MKKLFTLVLIGTTFSLQAQVNNVDTTTNEPMNSAANIIAGNGSKGVRLGAYAQLDYNQQFGDTTFHNGKLDVHLSLIHI